MLPPLNGLRAFEAVARHKSFTRAAGELSVSQSAVSHQVRGLEQALNLRLLSREGRSVELTREGRLLFEDLSESLARIRRALANLEAVRRATPLGVSVRPHFAMPRSASGVVAVGPVDLGVAWSTMGECGRPAHAER